MIIRADFYMHEKRVKYAQKYENFHGIEYVWHLHLKRSFVKIVCKIKKLASMGISLLKTERKYA